MIRCRRNITYLAHLLLGALCAASAVSGQATSPTMDVRTIAEVESRTIEDGEVVEHLLPATRVVPGDVVIYTLEIRNTGSSDVVAPTVIRAIPEHTSYLANTATGPGADIAYSVDGGVRFDRPEALKTLGSDGRLHPAEAAAYTHIRWQLKSVFKAKSVAFARFRAVVR